MNEGSSDEENFDEADPPRMVERIRATRKTCLAHKILGSGRRCQTQEHVRAAFDYAVASIKPQDAVVVGMFPRHEDQLALDVEYAREACPK